MRTHAQRSAALCLLAIIAPWIFSVLTTTSCSAASRHECITCGSTRPKQTPDVDLAVLRTSRIQAQCPPQDQILLENVRRDYATLFPVDAPKVERVIRGRTLRGSERELEIASKMAGSGLLGKITQSGRMPDAWKTADCDDVLCVLGQVMDGEESARRALMITARDGYTISLLQSSDPTRATNERWLSDDLRTIDHALERLPQKLRRLGSLGEIQKRYELTSKGKDVGGFAAADSRRMLLDAEGGFSEGTVLHELAHFYEFAHGKPSGFPEADQSWKRNFLGWKRDPRGGKFVSDYAKDSDLEDFAETVSAYVLSPRQTKHLVPQKYQVLKNLLFEGYEYRENGIMPELDPLLAKKGISAQSLLKTCMDEITSVRIDRTLHQTLYYDVNKDGWQRPSRSCFKKKSLELAALLPDACALGGADAIERDLSARIAALEDTLVAAVAAEPASTNALSLTERVEAAARLYDVEEPNDRATIVKLLQTKWRP